MRILCADQGADEAVRAITNSAPPPPSCCRAAGPEAIWQVIDQPHCKMPWEKARARGMKTRLLESVPKYPQTVRGTCEYSQLPKSSHIYSHNPAQTLNPHRTANVKWSAVRDDERKAQGFVGGTLSLSLSGGRASWTPRTKDGWVWRGGATMLQCSKSKCFAVVQMFCSSPNVLQ